MYQAICEEADAGRTNRALCPVRLLVPEAGVTRDALQAALKDLSSLV